MSGQVEIFQLRALFPVAPFLGLIAYCRNYSTVYVVSLDWTYWNMCRYNYLLVSRCNSNGRIFPYYCSLVGVASGSLFRVGDMGTSMKSLESTK